MVDAYLLIMVEVGKEHEVATAISKIEGINEVVITYGAWDIVAKIVTNVLDEVDIIVTKIRRISAVKQSATLIGK